MWLLAVLGLQGIVVKCTAAIFFRTVYLWRFEVRHPFLLYIRQMYC